MSDLVVFFFFQAEDGIRDIGVTGVQTCALPISLDRTAFYPTGGGQPHDTGLLGGFEVARVTKEGDHIWHDVQGASLDVRSEERRVGKECRSRWSPYH